MSVQFWLYASKSLLLGAEAKSLLTSLVHKWQEANRAKSITGALVFTGSMFAQYVEGPEPALGSLRDAICADERHISVKTVDLGLSEKRIFEQWSLAYSGEAPPFDQLVAMAHAGTPLLGKTLLLEMMHRFTLPA